MTFILFSFSFIVIFSGNFGKEDKVQHPEDIDRLILSCKSYNFDKSERDNNVLQSIGILIFLIFSVFENAV